MMPAPVSLHLRVSGLFRDWGGGVCFSWPLPSQCVLLHGGRPPVRVHVDTDSGAEETGLVLGSNYQGRLSLFFFTMPLFFSYSVLRSY
jgi:hypothetical protein